LGEIELDAVGFTLRELEPVEGVFLGVNGVVISHPLAYHALGDANALRPARDAHHERQLVHFGRELRVMHPPRNRLLAHVQCFCDRALRFPICQGNSGGGRVFGPIKTGHGLDIPSRQPATFFARIHSAIVTMRGSVPRRFRAVGSYVTRGARRRGRAGGGAARAMAVIAVGSFLGTLIG
jgi:hypothetical protein